MRYHVLEDLQWVVTYYLSAEIEEETDNETQRQENDEAGGLS